MANKKHNYIAMFEHKEIEGQHEFWNEDCFCIPNVYYIKQVVRQDGQPMSEVIPNFMKDKIQ